MASGITEIPQVPNVEQRYVEGKGRCLFATQPLEKGETIFVEDPIIACQFAWNKTYDYSACEHCMKPLETVEENVYRLSGETCFELPRLDLVLTIKDDHRVCSNCGEKYCSETCRLAAWKQYHRLLCFNNTEADLLFQLVERWKQIHYPPESMNIMLLAKLVATIHLAENKEMMYNQFMQFCHLSGDDKGALACTLLGEKFRCDIDNLWNLFSKALHERCINGHEDPVLKTLLTREGFIKMLSLIARNGQGIGTSILAEWANKVLSLNNCTNDRTGYESLIEHIYQEIENHVGIFINNEGSGLYSMQSCINHSCAPNAKIAFPFNCSRLALVAKKNIVPGEEILITYLDKCSRKRSCHSRRKILLNHYLFKCLCSKCISDSTNEPDVTSDEDDDMDEDM